jgi:Ser/Thr protein kinase RdoA (MazF antagonist)
VDAALHQLMPGRTRARSAARIEIGQFQDPGGAASRVAAWIGSRRAERQVRSELAVVEHVAEAGVRVARPVRSRSGYLTHATRFRETELIACVFQEAHGVAYDEWRDRESSELFGAVGESMERLHIALSARRLRAISLDE